jgi:GT2 family glycosyltransferase
MNISPILIREVELTEPLTPIEPARAPGGTRYDTARVLVRWYSEPLTMVDVPLTEGSASAEGLASALWRHAGPLVSRRAAAAGQRVPAALPVSGVRLLPPAPYPRTRAEMLATAPPASVIICTRDRLDGLARSLDAVERQEYPDYEIIVVDNAPTTTAVADLIRGRRSAVPVRHVVENRPGLSWARNTGLAAAAGRIIAYLDDDERPDRYWLAEMARGFTVAPGVAGVSGLVLPAVLDTPAQCLFERFGGHSKGRGFVPAVFDPASHARQHPLYPLPAFGVGASMAFDRSALAGIGGFDVALGAGTPARAGEDTAAISDLMLAGVTFVYWPGAIMWHEHRREVSEMARQLFGYGSGLTAFYARTVLRRPGTAPTLARLMPQAFHDLRGRDSVRTATMGDDYPAGLRGAMRLGMYQGPARYLRSLRLQSRVA